MKQIRVILLALTVLAFFSSAYAQSNAPLVLVMTADGPITPVMKEYLNRGLKTAEQRNAEVLIIQLNTPGGDLGTTEEIIQAFRASPVPVVIYVSPNGSMAGSAGAIISMAAHGIAMAPEAVMGAASPIDSNGQDLTETLEKKVKEIIKGQIRPLVTPRGPKALELAESMIDDAKAATAEEALEAGLIDFISKDVDELLEQLNGFKVETSAGPLTINTANAEVQPLEISFIEQLLMLLTDPNISFLLLAIGVQAILIEISSPGGWVAGFIGAVCLTLAIYGIGILPVNWFGFIFLIMAFVLFILDIKAPTHGALTAAGVASFIVGALVLFNSPGTPQFQRVSVPLVVGMGIFIGLIFFTIMMFALRAQSVPVRMGVQSLLGKTGTVKTFEGDAGQVQLESELWSAEKSTESDKISKGDSVEVVQVKGLRLIVKKK